MTKSWLATYLIKTLIINKALTNAVIKPIEKMGTWCILSTEKLVAKSNNDAANIIGIAKKNENSVAVFRSSPDIKPPMIVEADLETPGIKAKH